MKEPKSGLSGKSSPVDSSGFRVDLRIEPQIFEALQP